MSWIEIHDQKTYDSALALTRGCYQRDVATGYESWSGSTLKVPGVTRRCDSRRSCLSSPYIYIDEQSRHRRL